MPLVDEDDVLLPAGGGRDPRGALLREGWSVVVRFCTANGLPTPRCVALPASRWRVGACAYYRPQVVTVCPALCARPAPAGNARAWSWPGSTTDRTPYGVVAHELGHHADWSAGRLRWDYGSEYGAWVMGESGEPPLTSYAPNPAEWFAEHFRLFVTNPALLRAVRPRTFAVLSRRWRPRPDAPSDWRLGLAAGCPDRILRATERKTGGV